MREDLAGILLSLPLQGETITSVKRSIDLSDAGWSEKQRALLTFQAMVRGSRLYRALIDGKNGKVRNKIPHIDEWVELSVAPAKDKAEWFIKEVPQKGTFEFNAFKRLVKAFEFESNEFWYWRRKLRS